MFKTPAINSKIATNAARPIPLSMASAPSLEFDGPLAPRRRPRLEAMDPGALRRHSIQVILGFGERPNRPGTTHPRGGAARIDLRRSDLGLGRRMPKGATRRRACSPDRLLPTCDVRTGVPTTP